MNVTVSAHGDPDGSSTQSSVMALQRSGRGKLLALGGVLLVAAGLGAYLLLASSSSRGAADIANRVLIVGPESVDLGPWLDKHGFATDQRSFASAVTAGQDLDPTLDGIEAVAAFADEQGFGFLAIHPPELYELGTMGSGGASVPPGATVAVMPIGDLAKKAEVTYGVPSAAVAHPAPFGQQVGLMLALFKQPRLAAIADGDVDASDLGAMADLRSDDAVEKSNRIIAGQSAFDKLSLSWEAATQVAAPPLPMIPLGRAFEKVDAYPLADGGILALTTEPGWESHDGYRAELGDEQRRYARYLKPGDVADSGGSLAKAGSACGPVDVTDVHAIHVSGSGDSLALQRNLELADVSAWSVQIIKHDSDIVGCPFAAVGYPLKARQMYDLGPPHPSGAMLMVSDRLRFGFKGGERSWNYPLIGPDGGAAAWVDGTLVAYAGNSRYDETTRHGLAFMSALTENRLEAFFPLHVLLPEQDTDTMTIEHITPVSAERLLLVVGDRRTEESSVVEVTFREPIRSRLVAVDHREDMPPQLKLVMATSSRGLKTRVVLDKVPALDGGTFGAQGSVLAYASHGQAFMLNLDGNAAKPKALSPADFGARDVRIAPSGKFVIFHHDVTVDETTIRTASIVTLP